MSGADLLAAVREAGIEPDPAAGRRFRASAATMATTTDSDMRRAAATEAAEALVAMAAAGAVGELRGMLTPDPVNNNVTWTVACYQVGDLTPSALRDFSDPVEAVLTLAACPEPNHVAAELVASTSMGLRWTAVVRTNTTLAFQAPDAETASDASHEHATELTDALQRWRRRLGKWAGGEDVVDVSAPDVPAQAPAARMAPAAATVVLTGPDPAIDERLAGIERTLGSMSAAVDRLAAAEATVASMAVAVERLAAAEEARHQRLAAIERSVGAAERRSEILLGLADELRQGGERREQALADLCEALPGGLDERIAGLEQLSRQTSQTVGRVAKRQKTSRDKLAGVERALTDVVALAEQQQLAFDDIHDTVDSGNARLRHALLEVARSTAARLGRIERSVDESARDVVAFADVRFDDVINAVAADIERAAQDGRHSAAGIAAAVAEAERSALSAIDRGTARAGFSAMSRVDALAERVDSAAAAIEAELRLMGSRNDNESVRRSVEALVATLDARHRDTVGDLRAQLSAALAALADVELGRPAVQRALLGP